MATDAQVVANRHNAQKSTGPQTPQGKTTVSQNAVKHGLTAVQTVISSENQADFDLFREQLLDELAPASPMASILAERIVDLSWRLKRISNIQNQTFDVLLAPKTLSPLAKLTQSMLPKDLQTNSDEPSPELALGRLAIKDFSNERVLERLLMYERRIENSLYKTVLELQRLNLIKKMTPDQPQPTSHESRVIPSPDRKEGDKFQPTTNEPRFIPSPDRKEGDNSQAPIHEPRTTNDEQSFYAKQTQSAGDPNEHITSDNNQLQKSAAAQPPKKQTQSNPIYGRHFDKLSAGKTQGKVFSLTV